MKIASKSLTNKRALTIPANAQAAAKLGWTRKNVAKLLHDLRGILDKFHHLTRNQIKLELLVGHETRGKDWPIIEFKPGNQEIRVFLQAGPSRVLDLAPLILGDGLFKILTAGTPERRSPIIIFSGETSELVYAATVAITNSYHRERQLDLDKESLYQMLSTTAQIYGQNLARLKTIYQTLCGPCLPRDYLTKLFNETIETTRRELTTLQVNPEARYILTTIGRLAMIHTITKRIGLTEVALAAHHVLIEEPGDHLVLIELLQMRAGRSNPSPPSQWMIELQRRTGKPSYSEIFYHLVRIFDHQYDSFALVPSF